MIQELLSGAMEERKMQNISIPRVVSSTTSSPTTPSSPMISSPSPAAPPPPGNAEPPLRCPRCDSSNTKFCYYNNYNLTQPRHFCKTCRRYWTKGGALRNVPIGGGCRKAKPGPTSVPAKASSPAAAKPKPTSADLFQSAPLFWANAQNTAHLMSLLRANTNTNTNSNSNTILSSVRAKEDGGILGIGSLNAQSLSLYPSIPYSYNPPTQSGRDLDVAGSGMHELYQVIKSNSGNNYYNDQLQAMIGNGGCFGSSRTSSCSSIDTSLVSTSSAMVGNTTTATATPSILEPIPFMGGDQFGCWNHAASWADLSTTNGAFPLN
ncbi:uncharacterized protein [Typha latifolia]|uniref:uncharacterized protein n=1 Tax=Typha latifolia TaxID=4733 RepID=UPI003C2D247C